MIFEILVIFTYNFGQNMQKSVYGCLLACLLLLLFDRRQKIDFLQELPKDVELGANFGRYPGDVMVGHADAPQAKFWRKSFLRFFGVRAGQF